MPERYIFTPATQADAGAVLQLYRDVVNTPGCTWDDTYPAMENIAEDLAQGALYCLRDAAGMPAAAASIGALAELDDLAWPEGSCAPCELARIGVRPDLQGRGIGTRMLDECITIARRRGFDGIRMLVSPGNAAALALYGKRGFSCTGRTFRYGLDFLKYQKLLDEDTSGCFPRKKGRVHLICGKIASGKTRYAGLLHARMGAVQLSCDKLMLVLEAACPGLDFDVMLSAVKSYLHDTAVVIARNGTDVILDWGAWTRAERRRVTEFYRGCGLDPVWHYIHVTDMDWQENIRARSHDLSAGKGGAYAVDMGLLNKMEAVFEEPAPGEMDVWIENRRTGST